MVQQCWTCCLVASLSSVLAWAPFHPPVERQNVSPVILVTLSTVHPEQLRTAGIFSKKAFGFLSLSWLSFREASILLNIKKSLSGLAVKYVNFRLPLLWCSMLCLLQLSKLSSHIPDLYLTFILLVGSGLRVPWLQYATKLLALLVDNLAKRCKGTSTSLSWMFQQALYWDHRWAASKLLCQMLLATWLLVKTHRDGTWIFCLTARN